MRRRHPAPTGAAVAGRAANGGRRPIERPPPRRRRPPGRFTACGGPALKRTMAKDARSVAATVLAQVLEAHRSLSAVLPPAHTANPAREPGIVQELSYRVLRTRTPHE